MPDPIVAPAGQHGHRWLARSAPEARFEIAVLAYTETDARARYAASWARWEALMYDGDVIESERGCE